MYWYYCNLIIGLVNVCNYFKLFLLKIKKFNLLVNWFKVYKMVFNKEYLIIEGLEMIWVIKKIINFKN